MGDEGRLASVASFVRDYVRMMNMGEETTCLAIFETMPMAYLEQAAPGTAGRNSVMANVSAALSNLKMEGCVRIVRKVGKYYSYAKIEEPKDRKKSGRRIVPRKVEHPGFGKHQPERPELPLQAPADPAKAPPAAPSPLDGLSLGIAAASALAVLVRALRADALAGLTHDELLAEAKRRMWNDDAPAR